MGAGTTNRTDLVRSRARSVAFLFCKLGNAPCFSAAPSSWLTYRGCHDHFWSIRMPQRSFSNCLFIAAMSLAFGVLFICCVGFVGLSYIGNRASGRFASVALTMSDGSGSAPEPEVEVSAFDLDDLDRTLDWALSIARKGKKDRLASAITNAEGKPFRWVMVCEKVEKAEDGAVEMVRLVRPHRPYVADKWDRDVFIAGVEENREKGPAILCRMFLDNPQPSFVNALRPAQCRGLGEIKPGSGLQIRGVMMRSFVFELRERQWDLSFHTKDVKVERLP